MTDCPNAEVRDLLPDLLHERLDASARALVTAHVAQCTECRAELTMLREARIALTSDMRTVDISAIAAAVIARTSAPLVHAQPWQRRARMWMDWRVAASIALVAAGVASFATIRARQTVLPQPVSPAVATTASESAKSAVVVPTPPRPVEAHLATPAVAELSAAGGVSDLSDNDLRALLDDLQSIDAEPLTDPDPVSVRITLPGAGRGGID
jgi:anti-sigma factor RsiW